MGARNGYVLRAGYRPSGDDDNQFQSEAIYESGATKAVVLVQPVLVFAGVGPIQRKFESLFLFLDIK